MTGDSEKPPLFHKLAFTLLLFLVAGPAFGQSTPNWALHYVPPPAEWNGLWASKVDVTNGALTTPSITRPTITGTTTIVGATAITGNLTVSGTISGSGGSFLPLSGGDLTGALTTSSRIGQTITQVYPSNTTQDVTNTPFFVSQTLTGAVSTSFPGKFNSFHIRDTVDASGVTAGISDIEGFSIQQQIGGQTAGVGQFKGSRIGLDIQLVGVAPNFDTGFDFQHSALRTGAFANNSSAGSTTLDPKGSWFGLNVQAVAQTASLSFKGLVGMEVDIALSAGSTIRQRTGISIVNIGAAQALGPDSALYFYGASGTPDQWKAMLLFGGSQEWPVDPAGTVMLFNIGAHAALAQPYTAKWIIDAEQVVLPSTGTANDGGFLRAINSSWDGNGVIQLGSAYLTPSSTGLAIDAKGSTSTSAAIASAGSGYDPAIHIMTTAYGGKWRVNFDLSGVATAVLSQLSPAQYASTTPPANPVALIDLYTATQKGGSGATINITWNSAGRTVAISPSGGPTTVGGNLVVTGTVTGSGGSFLPLVGGTLSGTLNGTAFVFTGTGQVQGTLNLGVSGSGSQTIGSIGTGNTLFNLGGSSSILNFRTSAGTSMLQLQTTNNVVAVQNSLALPTTKVWSGTSLAANAALFENSTWTGSSGSNATVVLHQIQSTEGIDAGTGGEVDGLQVQVNTNGTTWTGQRHAGQFVMNITTTSPSNSGTYTALNSKASILAPTGGTGLTPSTTGVQVFGNNPVARLGPTATFSAGVVGEEMDTWAQVDTMDKLVVQIVDVSGSAGIGARDSVALSFNNQYTQGSGGGFEYGLQFGRHGGNFPLTTTGTMIMTSLSGIGVNNVAATGINLLGTNFSKWAFITKGASIDSTGILQIGAGLVSPLSTGLGVDAAGALGTGTPVIVAAGQYFIVGDILTDPYGGVYSVATLSGVGNGQIATLTVRRQPFVPSRSSLPANPVTLTTWRVGQTTCAYPTFCEQWADGATATITWDTSPTSLTLNASGGPTIIGGTLKVGTAGMTANGAVATVMSNVGPTGSHTAIQEWFTVTNSAGTVRYIPAY